ncbi:MAG TPA: hypothetical protein VKJ47_23210 [Candidatus Binatia bacterium]|nr:hypothetical protein [Candidatus Binatia bacterium]
MMRARKTILVLLVGGVVSLVTAPAWGGDFCIQLGSGLIAKFVGKNFKVPGKGKCKPWAGFCATGCSPGTVQTGTACTAADGSQVTFGFTTWYAGGPRQFDFIQLTLPALTGSGNENTLASSTPISYSATGASCSVPVP